MKKLFIYYSHTGNGDLVAQSFINKDYFVRKVKEKHKMPKSFFGQMMDGGFRAAIGAKGKLINYDNDVSEFEEIVIGSPIWFDRFPPATNAIIKLTNLENKKLTFVFLSGSGIGKKAEAKVKKLFPNARIIFLKEPKKYVDELKKLEELF